MITMIIQSQVHVLHVLSFQYQMRRERREDSGLALLVNILGVLSAISSLFIGRSLYTQWLANSRPVKVVGRTCTPLCAQQPPSEFSSKRDVVFLFGTGFCRGLEIALKTLRYAGCRARVVLFTVPELMNDKKAVKLMNQLDIEVISNCQSKHMVPHMIRYNYEYDWLLNHTGQVDRVLHADSYDIFFQSDPFAEAISEKYLTFVVEPHVIQSCGWNLAWFTQCFGERETARFKSNFIICSGTIGGGVEHYVKLLRLMIESPWWKSCYQESFDQPILNHIVWSGDADNAGIKYRFTGCDGGIMTVQWCVINQKVRFNDCNQVLSPSNGVPALVHQYPRLEPLATHLFTECRL